MFDFKCENGENSAFVEESVRILHEAYISKKLVLFVGAGADIPSGLPSWSKAIQDFCKYLHISSEGVDNIRIPQFYYNSRGKKEYVELCRNIFFYNKELSINDMHKKIIDFSVNTIITTNYTDFLEREMNNRGHIYRVICQDKDLPYVKNENLIIKMHGDFDHDNFVLKEDDYLNYSKNFRLIETYIKSIIAKNVVLFIGYSFNDPDVKQIFSWVKDILGNDFQQAYMLNGFDSYDKNIFEYYKNLGVNVIYTETFGKDKQKVLLDMMDIIRLDKYKNISNIDVAGNYFRPYLNLNFILEKYISKGFWNCKLVVEAGKLKSIENIQDKKCESNILLAKLAEKMEKNTPTSKDSLGILINVLKKSGVDIIEFWDSESGLMQVQVSHDENELFDLIMEFDYKELRKNIEYDDLFDNGDDEQFYLRKAYMHYVLEEYTKSYKLLCHAAEKAFRKRKYYIYYIAQFNKFRVGNLVTQDHRVSKDMQDKINEDLERIDLEQIVKDIPELFSNDNQMLNDIGTFQLHYSLFQDAYRISQKVKKQQDSNYFVFSGIPDYLTLRWKIADYFQYLIYNYLMVDRYREVTELLALYIKSILGSVSTPDREGRGCMKTTNVHASRIGKFELFLMIKYVSEKDVMSMFDQYGLDVIPVEDDCKKYIRIVFDNLRKEDLTRDNELWNCMYIISCIDPDCDMVEDMIDCITKRINGFVYRSHQKLIDKFLYFCYKNKKFKNIEKDIFKIEKCALGRFLQTILSQVHNATDTFVIQRYSVLIQNVSYIFREVYQQDYNGDISSLLCDTKNLVLARLYSNCGKENKERIQQYFESWKGDASWESCEVYYNIVMNDIIKPVADYENLIFENINKIRDESWGHFPNDYQNILTIMCNLYMNDKLINRENYEKIIMNTTEHELMFLSDMENFDYTKFDLEWLYFFESKLLEKIASKESVRIKISKKFAEEMEKSEVSNKLLKIYFKYFLSSV